MTDKSPMTEPANEKAPRPRWSLTKMSGKAGALSAIIFEGSRRVALIPIVDDAEHIVAALNAQAPPPAEPPTLRCTCGHRQSQHSYGRQCCEIYGCGCAEFNRAAAPPPQPETLAADEIVERCVETIMQRLPWTESAGTFSEGQVNMRLRCFDAVRALNGRFTLAQPRTVTPETLPKLTAADVRKSRNVSAWDEAIADNLNAILAARTAPPGDGGAK